MLGALHLKVEDENAVDKLNRVKKLSGTTSTMEHTKRAALGDLQNRGVLRSAATGKDAAQKNLNDIKPMYGLRNAKPRVDTHWKKSSLTNTTNKAGNNENTAQSNAAAVAQKVLTRSNSVRMLGNAISVKPNASVSLQRHGSMHLQAGHKPKTLTAKVVESSKLQQVKNITKVIKTKSIEEKKVAPRTATIALKREDSNLSRRSLTKLKAVLKRDGSGGLGNKVALTKVVKAVEPVVKAVEPVVAVHKEPSEAPKTVTVAATTSKESCEAKAKVDTKTELNIVSGQTFPSLVVEAVEDIDAADSENLVLVSEYVNDIYDYFYQLESEQEIRVNHLEGQKEVFAKMRAVLIDWINEVHLQFRLLGETFHIAVAIIDRYLQEVKDTQRSHLQLVGVTALFIAAKYEELYPPSIVDFVYITDSTYTAKQILLMEMKIFQTLDCNLSRPLSIQFLRRFSKAANAEDIHHGMAKYFLELATVEYEFASYKPSEIAAASLFLSLNLVQENVKLATGLNDEHWTPTLEWYSRYNAAYLRPITRKLAAIVRNAPNVKLKATYTKYQSSKLHKVALRKELYSPLMDSIVGRKESNQK